MTRHANTYLCIAAALALSSAAARAQLPGLPAAKPADTGADTQPAAPPAAAPAPTGPVRGSLFKRAVMASAAQPIAGVDAPSLSPSYIAVRPPEAKHYRKNDIVTVVIREDSDSVSNGQGTNKKDQAFDLALQQFIQVALNSSGLPQVGTVNNPSNLPEIKFNYTNDGTTNAEQQRTDSFSARISATVVDVKPNGTLVIEAIKQIVVDKEQQTFKLSGICRADDVQADNTVLSTQLANLSLSKQTTGQVHDGTKRGWLNNLIDKMSPF